MTEKNSVNDPMATRNATSTGKEYRRRRGSSLLPGMVLLSLAIVVAGVLISKRSGAPEAAKQATAVVAEFDTVTIPVPVEPVAAGTRLRDVKFKNVAFPKHQLPAGALTSLQNLSDSVALTRLPANLPLFRENISTAMGVSNPVMEKIPPGMRAITIRVDATSAVEGWAGTGTMVDVILVEKDRSTVVAERVKILSAERSVSPVEGASAPSVPSTVTLLVTQDQALAINTAVPLGRIAFALRSAQDEDSWTSTTFTADRLKNAAQGKRESTIRGYVSIKEGGKKDGFALSDGKWVRSQVIPDGFFVADNQDKAQVGSARAQAEMGGGDEKD